jgi:uncharacterized protein
MTHFPQTPANSVKRVPKRAAYDHETIYAIVDAALICHVGLVQDGRPFVIPTILARDEDALLIHGASTSRLMRHAAAGHELCLTVTHLDGLVLARSVFNHSMNYRSAVLFGRGHLIEEPAAKMAALERFTEKLIAGRWADARQPNATEMKATSIVAIPIESASAKVRVGPPGDEEEDVALPIWAGVLPIAPQFGAPIPAPNLAAEYPLPAYLAPFAAESA